MRRDTYRPACVAGQHAGPTAVRIVNVSEELSEIETRLSAIEIFLCHTLSDCLAFTGKTDQIDRIHRELLQRVERSNMHELSPMFAEQMPDNLDYALRCLVSMQRRLMGLRGRLQP